MLPGSTASPRSHHQQKVFHTQVQPPASLSHFLNQLGSPGKSVGTRHLPTLRVWSSSLVLHPRPAALGEMCRVPAAYPPQPARSSLSSSQRQHVQKKLDIVRRRSRQSGRGYTGTILATQQREHGSLPSLNWSWQEKGLLELMGQLVNPASSAT